MEVQELLSTIKKLLFIGNKENLEISFDEQGTCYTKQKKFDQMLRIIYYEVI